MKLQPIDLCDVTVLVFFSAGDERVDGCQTVQRKNRYFHHA